MIVILLCSRRPVHYSKNDNLKSLSYACSTLVLIGYCTHLRAEAAHITSHPLPKSLLHSSSFLSPPFRPITPYFLCLQPLFSLPSKHLLSAVILNAFTYLPS
ncbi:Hypothetical predicted protein [Octopus vulgaris]|uniref:Uncharacterized protein n=1 Tax=Octopus vulgaris TaxID=6645 RepID=A0AA36B5F2_OCTVU|nr:Hypothetical predicted protein [Octopus vulgaris]